MALINYPKVSIIILNWNGVEDTIECIDSLKKITYPNYEVIIVDNNSKGNDVIILGKKYRNSIKIIRNKENLGFTGGNNVGIKEAEKGNAEFVLLLNNDTVVEPNFLEKLVRVALLDEKIAIVGSIVADYYTKKIVFTNSIIDKKLKAEVRTDYINSSKDYWETERVNGAAMMIKMKPLLEVPLFFDEDLFLYCDEIDLALRAKKHGFKIMMARQSKVYHKEGSSAGKSFNIVSSYYILRNRILLAKKLFSTKEKVMFWFLFLPFQLILFSKFFLEGKWNIMRIIYSAILDGIKGVKGRKNF